MKSYTTLLPAAAQDIYYRDEIGNISTSNARTEEEFVMLELRPRYVLCKIMGCCFTLCTADFLCLVAGRLVTIMDITSLPMSTSSMMAVSTC